MELNAEQIVKQMQEWSDNMCENACLKGESLNGKVHTCEICFPNTVKNALSLIKELAEKNKKLSAQNYMLCPDGTIAMIPTVKSVRTDTVQEVIASIDEMFRRQRYESMWIDKNGAVLGRVDIGDAQECWDGYIKPELERMLEEGK